MEWRTIKNFPNYEISNMGQVRNKIKILKPRNNGNGYLQVALYNETKKYFYIHRLVAIHFLPNWNNYEECDHKNNNRSDNRYCNIRWINRSNNMRRIPKKDNLTSKYKGVFWDKHLNKWTASIRLNHKKIILGRYTTEEEAYSKYCEFISTLNQ